MPSTPVKETDGRQQYLCLSQVLVTLLYAEAALWCLARQAQVLWSMDVAEEKVRGDLC